MDSAELASRYGIAAFTMRTAAIRPTSNDAAQFSGLSSIARALTFEAMMSMPPNASALLVTTQDCDLHCLLIRFGVGFSEQSRESASVS